MRASISASSGPPRTCHVSRKRFVANAPGSPGRSDSTVQFASSSRTTRRWSLIAAWLLTVASLPRRHHRDARSGRPGRMVTPSSYGANSEFGAIVRGGEDVLQTLLGETRVLLAGLEVDGLSGAQA